ncbi:hypothetical protein ACQP2F_19595 [Actinoplanes sp. CA-030573]|uniref:hypothetical protein n=1 Tax=Actinoplanes sp. CA-030573 TaxID=3239898 RepID=UPI003D8C2CB1
MSIAVYSAYAIRRASVVVVGRGDCSGVVAVGGIVGSEVVSVEGGVGGVTGTFAVQERSEPGAGCGEVSVSSQATKHVPVAINMRAILGRRTRQECPSPQLMPTGAGAYILVHHDGRGWLFHAACNSIMRPSGTKFLIAATLLALVLLAFAIVIWENAHRGYVSPSPTARPSPLPTTGRPTGVPVSPAPPEVVYRRTYELKPGKVLVIGRDRAAVHPAPTSGGFDVWWDVQLTADGTGARFLGEAAAAPNRVPDWEGCQALLAKPPTPVPTGTRTVCLNLRRAGTAVVSMTKAGRQGVSLTLKVWSR